MGLINSPKLQDGEPCGDRQAIGWSIFTVESRESHLEVNTLQLLHIHTMWPNNKAETLSLHFSSVNLKSKDKACWL